MHEPLNQILFGPPGTGKTYNTIFKTLDILAPLAGGSWADSSSGKTRKDALEEFNNLKKYGRICFTTFHQSMSYEDFIEGIKPIPQTDKRPPMRVVAEHIDTLDLPPKWKGETRIDNLPLMTYEVRDGLFKEFCKSANSGRSASVSAILKSAYDSLLDDIRIGKVSTLQTKTTAMQTVITPNSMIGLTTIGGKSGKYYTVSFPNIEKLSKSYPSIASLDGMSNIDNAIRKILGGCHSGSYWAVLYELYKRMLNTNESTALPYVFIIDEINRGNIANIFGELITLIEDEKRLGKAEGMTVTLPYSREEFGVPDNVYILGTMNTADRSVEALDTALRRRFTFVEMMPKPELLKAVMIKGLGKTLEELLATMNERIEVLKDREHLIGHSYFMEFAKVSSVNPDDLKEIFLNKIIPLLQEYFYGDYEKIQFVLGEGFIEKKSHKVKFAVTTDEDFNKDIFSVSQDPDMEKALSKILNI